MLTLIARDWWLQLLRGVFMVLFGIIAIVWPAITIQVVVILIAVLAFADGLLSLTIGLSTRRQNTRWGLFVVLGLLQIVFGIVVVAWPAITALALVYLLAAWSIAAGVLTIIGAFRIRKAVQGEWVLAIVGLAAVLFGILLFVFPGPVAVALVMTVGIFAIAVGALLILLAFRLRGLVREPDEDARR